MEERKEERNYKNRLVSENGNNDYNLSKSLTLWRTILYVFPKKTVSGSIAPFKQIQQKYKFGARSNLREKFGHKETAILFLSKIILKSNKQ